MFIQLKVNKQGIDCDDVFFTLKTNLEIDITIDEVFIIFYKVDQDSDGYWCFEELSNTLKPREKEYDEILKSRGGFYGSENDVKNIFESKTRESLKMFFRQFCECEISIELIR